MLPDFSTDKAIVIDGASGLILASKWGVANLEKGIHGEGTKSQAASAIAQEGFFAIKCSEDSCGYDGEPKRI